MTDGAGESAAGGTTQGDTAADETGAVGDTSSGGDDPGDEASGGTEDSGSSGDGDIEPGCGNGIVEDGEDCDDESVSCLDDCTFACSLVGGFVIPPGPSGTVDGGLTMPVPVPDGSGFLIPDTSSITLFGRDGEQVWRRGDPLIPYVISALPMRGNPDFFWMSSRTMDQEAALGLYEIATGAPVDVTVFPLTASAGVLDYDSQGNVIQIFDLISPSGPYVTVRALDEMAVEQWATELSRDPIGDIERLFYADIAEDGSIYLTGTNGSEGTFTNRAWLVKLAPDGTLEWDRFVAEDDPPLGEMYFGTATATTLGNETIVVARHQSPDPAPKIGSLPYVASRLLRVDADGEVVWELDPTDQAQEGRIVLADTLALSADRVAISGSRVMDGAGAGWFGIVDGQGTLLCEDVVDPDPVLESRIPAIFRDLDGAIGLMGARGQSSNVPGYVNDRFLTFVGE